MTLNTTPRTWVASEVVTATEMNTEVRDALTGIQASWTTYTPAISSGVTLGNGTIGGQFQRVGKTVDCFINLLLGTTSSITGTIIIQVPVAMAGYSADSCIGDVALRDNSAGAAGRYSAVAMVNTTTGGGTGDFLIGVSASTCSTSSPFVWASADRISCMLRYLAA